VRTTRDIWVVQGNYRNGHGWEDLTAEDTWKEIKKRLKEYRENEVGIPFRAISRRERIPTAAAVQADPAEMTGHAIEAELRTSPGADRARKLRGELEIRADNRARHGRA
jgi:hypothetical protein